ncbi:hypothetical protein BRD01_05895 [Halobacteriales archaeon QS_8_65_32]|nr:MAG: hypothetical protein BRD01_05895 [Halobacteriales archaeon QS_8_65_32]
MGRALTNSPPGSVESPRVMTSVVDCEPNHLTAGTRVRIRFVPAVETIDTDEENAIPVFTPVGE